MTRSVVVVGDVMLDVDVEADATRLVPDSAAPVLDERCRTERAGGAALAALLAARREGTRVTLVAPLPDDASGDRLRALLPEAVSLLAVPCVGRTRVKTRLRCHDRTLARLDEGTGCPPAELPAAAVDAVLRADAVLVSDYGGGATRDDGIGALLSRAARRAPLVWDPHPRGGRPVPAAALVTPNAAEAGCAPDGPLGPIRVRAAELRRQWQARAVAITLGARGALLCGGAGAVSVYPARPVRGDPCGAGDAFAAAAVSSLAAGRLPSEAVAAAVESASAFVAGGGVGALHGTAVVARSASAADLVARVRAEGGRVVATGGCFDLLHAGHLATLEAARAFGDCLVVCLNSDASVRRLKGASRPIQPQTDRARLLSALRCVDAVAVFDEDTPERVLAELRPDVWVKGGDYTSDALPETALLRSWGGEVVTVPYLRGRSTSELVGSARR